MEEAAFPGVNFCDDCQSVKKMLLKFMCDWCTCIVMDGELLIFALPPPLA